MVAFYAAARVLVTACLHIPFSLILPQQIRARITKITLIIARIPLSFTFFCVRNRHTLTHTRAQTRGEVRTLSMRHTVRTNAPQHHHHHCSLARLS